MEDAIIDGAIIDRYQSTIHYRPVQVYHPILLPVPPGRSTAIAMHLIVSSLVPRRRQHLLGLDLCEGMLGAHAPQEARPGRGG